MTGSRTGHSLPSTQPITTSPATMSSSCAEAMASARTPRFRRGPRSVPGAGLAVTAAVGTAAKLGVRAVAVASSPALGADDASGRPGSRDLMRSITAWAVPRNGPGRS
jgi:hypothetical protein